LGPTLNSTEPVGLELGSVAVKVTESPYVDGLLSLTKAVVVAVMPEATSVRVPKFVTLLVTPTITEAPVFTMFPEAKGNAAVGRTRMFCHVRLFVTPLDVLCATVNVSCVEEIADNA